MFLIATAGLILSVPLIAIQFTKEVNWGLLDFTIIGILLFGTACAIELILRKVKTLQSRIILCTVVLALLFLTWAELAVGIFGTPFAGN